MCPSVCAASCSSGRIWVAARPACCAWSSRWRCCSWVCAPWSRWEGWQHEVAAQPPGLLGLALGLFLPAHLYVLGLALEENRRLEQFLKFAELGAVKFGEWGLVILLSVHMCFGLRLLALELLPWSSSRDARLSWITWGAVLSAVVGVVLAVRVMR